MSPVADAVEPTQLSAMVALSYLRPSPLNPRKRFDPAALADLQSNLERHGVIVPMLVRRHADHGEVIDGERRYRAAAAAGLDQVPCVFRDELTDGEVIEIQLLSAIQRQDLTPLEEASGFKALIDSNPALYSAYYIADRIGRSEKYVWDTMKLLDLVPTAKELLERDVILVGHARLLAKLKPEDQTRAIDPEGSALFEGVDHLEFDEEAEAADPYRSLKPVTVGELERWISEHVKFDIQHAAIASPLDFGEVAEKVIVATAKPGRGKKVISITFDSYVQPDAKTDGERIFGPRMWKRADGTEGTTVTEYPKRKVADSPVCDHAVLGVVAIGEHYGESFEVCIAKDRCETHWSDEIKERKKNAELQASGKGAQAAKREASSDDKWKREQEARDAAQKAWEVLRPNLVAEAVNQVKLLKTLTPSQVKFLEEHGSVEIRVDWCRKAGVVWTKNVAAAALVTAVSDVPSYGANYDHYIKYFAKPLGLNLKKLDAVRAAHEPKAIEKTKVAKKATPAKAAKKAKKR